MGETVSSECHSGWSVSAGDASAKTQNPVRAGVNRSSGFFERAFSRRHGDTENSDRTGPLVENGYRNGLDRFIGDRIRCEC